MSVIYESENCVYISHETSIKKLYKNIANSSAAFKLNDELFAINAPFRAHSLKRKFVEQTGSPFDEIKSDIGYIKGKYETFKLEIFSELFDLVNQEKLELDEVVNDSNQETVNLNEQKEKVNNQEINYLNSIDTIRTLNCNSQALETSQRLYGESGIIPLINTFGGNSENEPIIVNVFNNDYLLPNNSKFYCKDVSEVGDYLCGNKYDLILMDPPWWNKAVRRKRAKTNQGYQMMHNDNLKDLPIENLLDKNGIVVVWCGNSPQHIQSLKTDIFEKWGVKLLAKWFWLKITRGGEPIVNFSEPPAKLPFERILIAARSHQPHKLLKESTGKIIVSVPSALHSHKPPLHEILEPYIKEASNSLEIFARYLLPNYTSYGLEALRFQNKCLYKNSF